MSYSRKTFLTSCLALAASATLLAGCGKTEKPAEVDVIQTVEAQKPNEATYYLVRHAEKELTGKDPDLSSAGQARAQALAVRLKDIKLDGVYSTDTTRTRDTAAQVMAEHDVSMTIYDGRALETFAQEMLTKEGNYLIVGHSNTTGELATALGGDGGEPIVEATEYDRFYIVRRTGDVIVTELQRY